MKTRTGFVSNSSSSSFVLNRHYVSQAQVDYIENHIAHAKMHGWQEGYTDPYDAWTITVTDSEVRGDTCMDNFSMQEFMDQIGVPAHAVTWED